MLFTCAFLVLYFRRTIHYHLEWQKNLDDHIVAIAPYGGPIGKCTLYFMYSISLQCARYNVYMYMYIHCTLYIMHYVLLTQLQDVHVSTVSTCTCMYMYICYGLILNLGRFKAIWLILKPKHRP